MDVWLTPLPSDLRVSDLLIYNHRATAGRPLSLSSVLYWFHPEENFLLLWLAEMMSNLSFSPVHLSEKNLHFKKSYSDNFNILCVKYFTT